jgi:peptidyl-prolyl cis-trans isomerase B (cyclophilin B)
LEDTSVASNKRERELARMRAERQAARRAAEEARRRQRRNAILIGTGVVAVVALVLVVALVTGLGKDEKNDTTLSSGEFGNKGGTASCTYTKSGDAAKSVQGLPPAADVRNTGTQQATITTDQGPITASLDTAKAPCTVNSFAFLAQQGYFNGTSCHRLTTSGIYVLQCGDPTASGSGGPGYQFADENLKGATYPKGTIAMANSGPGTNGSQFFLVYKDTQLPPSYTPFGTITDGLDVVGKVAAAGSDNSNGQGDGKPKQPIKLTKVTVS